MSGAQNQNTWNLSKELWPQDAINDEVLDSSPAFGTISKATDFGEIIRHIAVGTGMPQGVGTKFEVAKGNKSPATAQVFALKEKTLYVVISIDGVLLRKARVKGHEGMIVDPYTRESELAIQQWKNEQSSYFFGNGGGSLGQIGAISPQNVGGSGLNFGANYFLLKNINDIRRFQQEMQLNFATSDGTEAVTAGPLGGRAKITEVQEHGQLKGLVGTNVADLAAAGYAANNYIFRDGIYADVIPGKNAWIPRGTPGQADPVTGITTPGTFLGVDRTKSPSKLAGIRFDARKMNILDGIIGAASAIADCRGKADLAIISTADWNLLRIQTQGAGVVTRTLLPAAAIGTYKPGLSYRAFEIEGPNGPLQVLADPWCPVGRGYVEQSNTWTYLCVNELVALTGDPLRTEEVSDSGESRFVGDGTPYCKSPYYNATVQFADGV